MSQDYIEILGTSVVELRRLDRILSELARPSLDEGAIAPPAGRLAQRLGPGAARRVSFPDFGVHAPRAALSKRMHARDALLRTNHVVRMRPLVVFAIKVMAPGPRRVQMVRLAHAMTDGRGASQPSVPSLRVAATTPAPQVAPSQRAA